MLWEGRKSFSKAALLASFPPFPQFGPNLFQLFSMSCRCPLLGRREELGKTFPTKEQKAAAELSAGCKVGPCSLFVAINSV